MPLENNTETVADNALETLAPSKILRAFEEHQAALRRYISRLVRRKHDIDDVAQETFLRAFRAEQGRDEAIEKPKSFLFRIAHNIAITDLTRKSSQIMDYLAEVDAVISPDESASVEDEVSAGQMVGIHCEAVAQLPAQCRRVYLMRKVHGMSHRDIAERLEISVRTVEKHISKGSRDCWRYVSQREQCKDPLEQVDHSKTQSNTRTGRRPGGVS